jgi:hypothetical protein
MLAPSRRDWADAVRLSHLPSRPDDPGVLSRHILPSAATMIGVCTTLIGLVKIVEVRTGPSHIDEYAALTSLLFLASAATSYLSMRWSAASQVSSKLEGIADTCFICGLLSLFLISVLFAYKAV